MQSNQLQFIATVVGLLLLLNGMFLWAVKWLLDRSQKQLEERLKLSDVRLDERLTQLARQNSVALDRIERAEKDLLRMREELAREYVRRDDWIRFSTTIMAKLDAVWAAIDALKERLHAHRSSNGAA